MLFLVGFFYFTPLFQFPLPTFCSHFQMNFIDWKFLYFVWNFTEVWSYGCHWQQPRMGSGNGSTTDDTLLWYSYMLPSLKELTPSGQNGRHFADDIFLCTVVNETFYTLIRISLKFDPKGLKLILAWISNHMPHICGMESLIHSQTSTAKPLKFGYG